MVRRTMACAATDPSLDETSEIEVFSFGLDDGDVLSLELAESWLSGEERARAARFRFPVHRDRYVRGRAMVRWTLSRRLRVDPASLVLVEGERGKPRLADAALEFNLSHSEDRAALAVGRVPGIGIDLERYDRRVDARGLSRRCFRETEIAWLETFPESERHLAFFRIWTAKEARMKATGEGFQLEPKRIEIGFEGAWPYRCLEPVTPVSHLVSLDLGDAVGAVVALAPFRVRRVDPPPAVG